MLRRLIHFFLLGALVFALERAAAERPAPERETIEVRLAPLRARIAGRADATPDRAALDALVAAAVDEEILVRAAIAAGAHRSDAVVRQHLARNLRFLGADPAKDDDALLAEALALGMERTDPVARRRLAFAAEQAFRAAGRGDEPTPGELRRHLEANRERFRREARVAFGHVFFSAERRGAALERDAAALLAALRTDDVPLAEAVGRGDPWLLAHTHPLAPVGDAARIFGRDFAEALRALPVGEWSGPLGSAHGLHLVRIEEKRPAEDPPLSAVRDRVRYAVYAEREARAFEEGLARLRARYDVRLVDAKGDAS